MTEISNNPPETAEQTNDDEKTSSVQPEVQPQPKEQTYDEEKIEEILVKFCSVLDITSDVLRTVREVIDGIAAQSEVNSASTTQSTDVKSNVPPSADVKPADCTCPNTCAFMTEKSYNQMKSIQKNLSVVDKLICCAAKQQSPQPINELPEKDLKSETAAPKDIATVEPKLGAENKTDTISVSDYEVCTCDTKEAKSKSGVGDSKSQTKEFSKSSRSRKSMSEKFFKEKADKFSKIKESIQNTQTNLEDIQKQVRQLDRLFQEYDPVNTPEGQVNPAALYKEIMKPQSISYTPKRSMPTVTPIPSPCNDASCPAVSSNSSLPGKSQTSYRLNKEKVSVLSAVPLEQAFL